MPRKRLKTRRTVVVRRKYLNVYRKRHSRVVRSVSNVRVEILWRGVVRLDVWRKFRVNRNRLSHEKSWLCGFFLASGGTPWRTFLLSTAEPRAEHILCVTRYVLARYAVCHASSLFSSLVSPMLARSRILSAFSCIRRALA